MKNPRVILAAISAVLDNGKWYISHGSTETEVSTMSAMDAGFYMKVFQPLQSTPIALINALSRAVNPMPMEEMYKHQIVDCKEKIRLHKGVINPIGMRYYATACADYVWARFGGAMTGDGIVNRTTWSDVPVCYLYDNRTGLFVVMIPSPNPSMPHKLYYFERPDATDGMMDVYVRNHLSEVGWNSNHSFFGSISRSEEIIHMLEIADKL